MANLLQSRINSGVVGEYRLRIAATLMFLLSLGIVAATMLLLPAYLAAESDLKTVDYEIESLKSVSESVISPELQAETSQIKARLDFLKTLPVTGIDTYIEYGAMLNSLPNELNMTSIMFNMILPVEGESETQTEPMYQMKVIGFAESRNDLSEAVQKLREINWVTDVEFPLSNLASADQVNFNLTITYNPDLITPLIDYRSNLASTDFIAPNIDSNTAERDPVNQEELIE